MVASAPIPCALTFGQTNFHMIRNSAKALIEENGKILVIRKRGQHGDYFVFPGGGQEKFETIEQALQRECREEIGVDVTVEDLIFMREYIARNHEFAKDHPNVHQVEFYFSCKIQGKDDPRNGDRMDMDQISVEWVPVARIKDLPIYPQSLRKTSFKPSKIYCGDTN
jgi:8-oxo-dGTP diphosphatase